MSDRESLLTLPMVDVGGDPKAESIGDPLLDILGAFIRDAVNNDTKRGWQVIHPRATAPHSEALPIAHVRTHNPTDGEFAPNLLPAVFLWRASFAKLQPIADWKAQVSQIAVLWVPPLDNLDRSAFREPFRNAVAKAMHRNLERGRNPGWKVFGDTEEKAAEYGSFLNAHANIARLQCLDIKPYPLVVNRAGKDEPYDALVLTIEVTELLIPVLDDYSPDVGTQGSFTLGSDALTYATFEFRPTLISVSPSTGGTAGGTAITLRGAQFWEDELLGSPTVTVGDVACTSVVLVDANTITALTPAGTVGAKTVKVTSPNGQSASLASAFTYA